MPIPIAIFLAGIGFGFAGLLGLIRILVPLRAIDRLRIRLLSYMLCLGMGIDDAAVARMRRIPGAEAILEEMVAAGGPKAIFPQLALQMLRL
jgi:hypothetical protein